LPSVSLSLNPDTVCLNTVSYALTGGSPNGGAYSGVGVSAGNFNPNTAGAGLHNIIYTYTDGNNCTKSATKQLFVAVSCAPTGINQLTNGGEEWIISPNPTNGVFTIESNEKNYEIVIVNVLGEKIYASKINSSKTEIDLSGQPQGIYFVKIYNGQTIFNKKIVIQ